MKISGGGAIVVAWEVGTQRIAWASHETSSISEVRYATGYVSHSEQQSTFHTEVGPNARCVVRHYICSSFRTHAHSIHDDCRYRLQPNEMGKTSLSLV